MPKIGKMTHLLTRFASLALFCVDHRRSTGSDA